MRVFIAAAVLLLTAALGQTAAQAGVPKDIGKTLLDGYIRPATTHFSNAAAAMTGALEFYCRAPDLEREKVVRERFESLVEAWFRVLILRFGPMVEDNRFERVFFWPDARGTMLRQVQEILAGYDTAAVNPDQLAEKSVAVQGLPALEFALYGTGADVVLQDNGEGRYRCAYALAVSQRIAATAAELAEAWSQWSPYAREFGMPGPQNEIYRTDEEVAAEAVKAMSTALTYLSDAVVSPFLSKEPESANYKRAPFWRSGQTIPALRNGLDGLQDFYETAGFSDALDETDKWIDGSLELEMRNAVSSLNGIDQPLEAAIAPGPGREALIYVVIAMKSLHTTIETRLAPAIGIAVGFNALDGD